MREIWRERELRAVPKGEALDQHFTGAILREQVIHDALAKLTFHYHPSCLDLAPPRSP